ncbi:metal ABC transporter substrate-binding protein [Elusimicrobiota bacterium]
MRTAILALALLLGASQAAQSKLRVVTTSEDLAYIARRVGGDRVRVTSLSSGDQDLHLVEPRPSMVMKVKRAHVFVRIGLDIDMWADALLAAARNKRVAFGSPGYVDASVGMPLMQIPKGKVDGSMGDIHVYGNPHYWLDPLNSDDMSKNIMDGLCRVEPEHCSEFKANRRAFLEDLVTKLREWGKIMAPHKGARLVTYHNSWVYFARRFDLEIVGNIEPKPGIPPTPSHLRKLIDTMESTGAKVIMSEVYFPKRGPQKVAAKTGAKVLSVPSSVGGLKGIDTIFDLFDHITSRLAESL